MLESHNAHKKRPAVASGPFLLGRDPKDRLAAAWCGAFHILGFEAIRLECRAGGRDQIGHAGQRRQARRGQSFGKIEKGRENESADRKSDADRCREAH